MRRELAARAAHALAGDDEAEDVEAAGQTVVVEKRQLSTWRFLTTDLDDVVWRLAKIF